MRRARLGLALAIACALCVSRAHAHSRPLSYSFWTLSPGGAAVRLQIATADLDMIGLSGKAQNDTPVARFFQAHLRMLQGGAICEPLGPATRVASNEPWLILAWSVHCSGDGPRAISASFVDLLETGHRHLARLDDGSGRALERILDFSDRTWPIDENARSGARTGSAVLDYVLLGVEHLWTGWDHMAFLLGLLLLAHRAREVIALVTSFTVAHSITLALAAFGVVRPNAQPVEALIAFSIGLLGAENCWLLSGRTRAVPGFVMLGLLSLMAFGGGTVTRGALCGLLLFCACHFALLQRAREPAALRITIAFAFGLIHGLGFAAVMRELDLPVARLVPALFGFNLGVELGQLVLVLLTWPLLRALARLRGGRFARTFDETVSAAVWGLGLFWFLVRSLA